SASAFRSLFVSHHPAPPTTYTLSLHDALPISGRAALHYEGALALIVILRAADDRRHIRDRPCEQARQTGRGGVAQIDAEGAAEVREQRRSCLRVFRSELPAWGAFERAGIAIYGEISLAERRVVRGRRRKEYVIVRNRIASEITRRAGGRHRALGRRCGGSARALGAGVADERGKTEAQNGGTTSNHARLPRKSGTRPKLSPGRDDSARPESAPAGLYRGLRHRVLTLAKAVRGGRHVTPAGSLCGQGARALGAVAACGPHSLRKRGLRPAHDKVVPARR